MSKKYYFHKRLPQSNFDKTLDKIRIQKKNYTHKKTQTKSSIDKQEQQQQQQNYFYYRCLPHGQKTNTQVNECTENWYIHQTDFMNVKKKKISFI